MFIVITVAVKNLRFVQVMLHICHLGCSVDASLSIRAHIEFIGIKGKPEHGSMIPLQSTMNAAALSVFLISQNSNSLADWTK